MKFRALAGLGLLLVSGTAAWAQQSVISTIAGGAPPPTPITAVNASIGRTYGVATDAAGNVYFTSDNCVFRLEQQNGVLTRRREFARWFLRRWRSGHHRPARQRIAGKPRYWSSCGRRWESFHCGRQQQPHSQSLCQRNHHDGGGQRLTRLLRRWGTGHQRPARGP